MIGHIKYAMEAEYWTHQAGVVSERLQDNSWTSPRAAGNDPPYLYRYNLEISLVLFDTDELQRALTIVESLSVHKLYWAARARLSNFYGEIGTRLGTDHTAYAHDSFIERRTIFQFFNFVHFGSPSTHVRQINSIWVDDRPRWKFFMDRLMSQWSGPAIYSMVSLVVSVLLVQSGRHQDSINRATAFMTRMTRSFHGEGGLAIIFSLLYAPVIWWTISKGGTSIPQERRKNFEREAVSRDISQEEVQLMVQATEQEFDALDVDLQHQYAQDVPLPAAQAMIKWGFSGKIISMHDPLFFVFGWRSWKALPKNTVAFKPTLPSWKMEAIQSMVM
ncbi:hypothetical protein EDB19DRAFT_1825771, partial [Suillus lakei]